ncbi:MAG: hypothetical protein HYV27_21110 [Candidatus Hydrogenedentes bacterium]|nr:hypothetical protein [Candidatus Hydrogenedentota bacterium]
MENGTNDGSGTTANAAFAWLNQRTWRSIGSVSLLLSAGMAWWGIDHLPKDLPMVYFGVYWAIDLLALLVACYMALLDMRYLRLQFALEERKLFRDALGDEAIRRAIQEHREAVARQSKDDDRA